MTAEVARLQALLAATEAKLHIAELRIEQLEAQRRLELIAKYGPASERLSDGQLQLLELEPGVCRAEVRAEAQREPLPAAPPPTQPPRRRRHPGRQSLPAHLPRVDKVIPVAPEHATCGECGQATHLIGYETSEQLDVIPAQYLVIVVKREKRACPHCRSGVHTAPAPVRIVDKSLLSNNCIVNTLVAKYGDHLPLYRQSAMLERDSGVEISRATLDELVIRVGELLIPIRGAIRQEIVASGYIQADETPVPVQLGRTRKIGRHHQAYLWQYGTPGGGTVFDFRMGRNRDGPRHLLADFEGLLQTDGYAAYNGCGRKVEHAACWAHARRKFVEALKLNRHDRDALRLLARINALFAVDAEARERGLDLQQRHALRQSQASTIVRELYADLQQTAKAVLPSGAVGKAITYTLGLWDRLTLFLQRPRLELSNNLAENSIRPVAVGRKNWIHVGSPQAGPKIAAIISVIETCRRLNLPVRRYLCDVLPGLADRSHHDAAHLTPAAWARTHALPSPSTL